ncbi:hypothetical protein ACIQUB_06010 [Rhizobium sp. NPDC090275]|uniref:hypothetical protein n=1 Tax=Rhizobium sp. NPDC090275 TaxID=3364498 RepID=UPI003839DA3E
MSSSVRKTFISKLSAQSRCPVCGGERSGLAERSFEGAGAVMTVATYDCEAIFGADAAHIINLQPCASGSALAAKLMTIEVHGGMPKEGTQ